MHIVLAVEELSGIHGGVERTIVSLANYLITQNHSVTILTFEKPSKALPIYSLNHGIKLHHLGLIDQKTLHTTQNKRTALKSHIPQILTNAIRNALAIKRAICLPNGHIPKITDALKTLKPDVIISFKTHFHRYIIPAAKKAKTPVIASDHNPPHILYYQYLCAVDRIITWHYLRQAMNIRVLLPDFINDYPQNLQKVCTAIPNGITLPPNYANHEDDNLEKVIIHVGRLYFQKDQETLIRAFASIANDYPDWQLKIYGSGPLEDNLKHLTRELAMGTRIHFMGATSDIMQAYAKAHIFALPSLFEGFGNVTLEAMASGLPVVAFDNCAANRSLVDHEKTGVLVAHNDRVNHFASGLKILMDDKCKRAEFGHAAREKAKTFDKIAVMKQWETLIKEHAKEKDKHVNAMG